MLLPRGEVNRTETHVHISGIYCSQPKTFIGTAGGLAAVAFSMKYYVAKQRSDPLIVQHHLEGTKTLQQKQGLCDA